MDEKKNVTSYFCVFLAIGADSHLGITMLVANQEHRSVMSEYEKDVLDGKCWNKEYCKKTAESIFKKHGIAFQGKEDWIVVRPREGVQYFGDSNSIETTFVPVIIPRKHSKAMHLPQKGTEFITRNQFRYTYVTDAWFHLGVTSDDHRKELIEEVK